MPCHGLGDGTDPVKGVIVCPKDVQLSSIDTDKDTEGTQPLVETTSGTDWYSLNKIDSWVIDENGLLFLPAAGYRQSGVVSLLDLSGRYTSRSAKSRESAYHGYFAVAAACV